MAVGAMRHVRKTYRITQKVFMFSGQNSPYDRTARALYDGNKILRREMPARDQLAGGCHGFAMDERSSVGPSPAATAHALVSPLEVGISNLNRLPGMRASAAAA